MVNQVRKRDGRVVPFKKEKISHAIFEAARAVGGYNRELALELAEMVVKNVESVNPYDIPSIEDIQDAIERVLMREEHYKTVKRFIIYRESRRKFRESKKAVLDVEKTMDEYLGKIDWRVQENSNVGFSLGGLILYISGKMTANYWLNNVYPPEIKNAHVNGDFHIHDLGMFSGYCAGWSMRQLLEEGFGGVPGQLKTVPPKHFDTVIGQIVNFLGTMQNEWAGAQALSSVDTYLAPFVRSDNMTYKQVKQQMQRLLFNIATPSRWGTQCVSEDTEALTNKGWKKYYEIKNEKIATFNLEKRKIEYLESDKIIAYDLDGEMIQMTNRIQDQLITKNHKVVRKIFSSYKFELVEAQKLKKYKTRIQVPVAAETISEKEIDDNKVQLIAWLVSEGSFLDGKGNRVYIFQSVVNKENCEEIREILSNLGYKWDESNKRDGFSNKETIRFRLNQETSREVRKYIGEKKIPNLIKGLSVRQLRLFIDTYVKGDGHKDKKGRIRIYTKDPDVKDDIQEICALSNYGSTIYKGKNGVYSINLIRNSITNITQIKEVKYKGKVWCPTTKNGTFIARRNGKVFITGNTPFVNFTFDWTVPEDIKEKKVIIGGKEQNTKYEDYQREMDLINKAFMECMMEGDAAGRVFTFPIPTYNITKEFDWENENAELLFKMTGKYGIPYFQNFVNSDLKPTDVRSMCCRLQMDLRQLRKKTGGLFGSGENTGSIGVVTINLPRLGFVSKNRNDLFNRLAILMEMGKNSLELKRKVVNKYLNSGLLPYTRRYLSTLDHHFSTIGLVGMNECCLNFIKKDITTEEGKQFSLEILEFMRVKLSDFQEETGNIYNLEATPAEGTSYRLARMDLVKYPQIITSGENEPFYTNSSQLPVGFTQDIFEALDHQEELQCKYTGGTVFHSFLGESVTDFESCKKLVKRIAHTYKIPYFTITPTFSVCPDHGYIVGEHQECPFEVMEVKKNE